MSIYRGAIVEKNGVAISFWGYTIFLKILLLRFLSRFSFSTLFFLG